MQAESGGVVHALSPTGAMGLMQIMPQTWAELRSRYGLGSDPFDPYDNVVAGTAYLRELLDRFGERGFLAAYNAGPSRYEEHLATGNPLPSETIAYMSAVTTLRESVPLAGSDSATSWRAGALFIASGHASLASVHPPHGEPRNARQTAAALPTATAHVPHSDGLFARTSDRKPRP
jgi:hypothetical protein